MSDTMFDVPSSHPPSTTHWQRHTDYLPLHNCAKPIRHPSD